MDESVRARIFAAADELYMENGKTRVPAVADVRKRAKADMNDACSAMREWRLLQGKRTGTVTTVPLPPELQAAGINTLAAFWHEATNLASESLIAAQTAWDAEKQVNEELCHQIAADFDDQAAELSRARQENVRLVALVQQHADTMQTLHDQLARACEERDSARSSLSEAMARVDEARKRAGDLERVVTYAREDADRAREQADLLRATYTDQMERARVQFRQELDSERIRLERERQRYEESANKATVEAATLRGRLEAMEARPAPNPGPRRSRRVPGGDGQA
jgi:colicin import membrane protein